MPLGVLVQEGLSIAGGQSPRGLTGFCSYQNWWISIGCMNMHVFWLCFLSPCWIVKIDVTMATHWCSNWKSPNSNVTCGTDLLYKRNITMHGDTFVFHSELHYRVQKLDPWACKSASVSMTLHKYYIINLKKMSWFFKPMAALLLKCWHRYREDKWWKETQKKERKKP